MAVEAYTPRCVEFDGTAVESPVLVTLYDADGSTPRGSLTAGEPIEAESKGSLVFEGARDGKQWRVVLPAIQVTNKSALGCEFSMTQPPQRTIIAEDAEPQQPHQKGFEEQFDIR